MPGPPPGGLLPLSPKQPVHSRGQGRAGHEHGRRESRPKATRRFTHICLYFIPSLSRTVCAFQSRCKMPTVSSSLAPRTGSPRATVGWAPGGGRLARTLQDREGPMLTGRHGRDPPWLSLVSRETGSPPWPGPGLCLVPSRRAPQGQGCPARPLLGHRPVASKRMGAVRGVGPAAGPHSLLVVIGGVGKGELQAVGLGQQQADVFIAPVGRGQVLQQQQQLLGGERVREATAAGRRRPGSSPQSWGTVPARGG